MTVNWDELAVDQLVCVTWEDTTNVAAWMTREEVAEWAESDPGLCRNAGWITHIDGDSICVSARRSLTLNPLQYGLTERIPREAVCAVAALASPSRNE